MRNSVHYVMRNGVTGILEPARIAPGEIPRNIKKFELNAI
jgi:hypothetical protein